MKKENIGIITGLILIVISALGHYVFNSGVEVCGSGETWPLYIKSALKVCQETVIPSVISKPFFWIGLVILAISVIILIINKIKKKK